MNPLSVPPDQVRHELSRVVASSAFQEADRAKTLLTFVVNAALEARAHEIKESVIGVEVLGRSTSFDPKIDPIVRVEVGRLRQRLKTYYDSEGAKDPVLITIPKGSYVPEFAQREHPNNESVVSNRRMSLLLVLAGLLTGIVLTALCCWLVWRPAVYTPLVRLSFIPPSGATIESSRISPDGKMIAFTAFQQNRTMLWIRRLDSPEPRMIPGTETASQVFWSPDSRSVGFFTTDHLYRVEVAGGPPQEICPVRVALGGGAWGKGGTIVFSAGPQGVLYQVSALGGRPKPATSLVQARAEKTHRSPEFLPDGKYFLYVANSGTGRRSALRIASIDSGESKLLLEGAGNAAYIPPSGGRQASLLFYFDGMLMAQPFDVARRELDAGRYTVIPEVYYRAGRADFSVSQDGTLIYRSSTSKDRQLGWYDRMGNLIEMIGEPNNHYALRLSPDDQRLAFIEDDPDWSSSTWVMDLATQQRLRVGEPGRTCFHPVWSPDGSEMIYSAGTEQGMRLLRQSPASTVSLALLDTPGPKFTSDWSRDGRYVAYFTPWPDFIRMKTVVYETKNGAARVLLESQFNETEAVFHPVKSGPKWLAYTSTETGRSEVYIRSFPDLQRKQQISTGGGWQPLWRQDGRELFYLSADGVIMVATVDAGEDFRAGGVRPLFRTTIPPYPGRPEVPGRSYAVSHDGDRFLVNQVIGSSSNAISVITHWQAIQP